MGCAKLSGIAVSQRVVSGMKTPSTTMQDATELPAARKLLQENKRQVRVWWILMCVVDCGVVQAAHIVEVEGDNQLLRAELTQLRATVAEKAAADMYRHRAQAKPDHELNPELQSSSLQV